MDTTELAELNQVYKLGRKMQVIQPLTLAPLFACWTAANREARVAGTVLAMAFRSALFCSILMTSDAYPGSCMS